MNIFFQKVKLVILLWVTLSVSGGVAITFGLEASLTAYLSVTLLFGIYYFSSNWVYLPVRNRNFEIATDESIKFSKEIVLFKQRANQIYVLGPPEIAFHDFKQVQKAYRSALFKTIAYGSVDTPSVVFFTKSFKKEMFNKASYTTDPSIDKLMLELLFKVNRTKLQNEYLSFVSCNVTSKSKGIEEIFLPYEISSGRLEIKKSFNNILGFSLIRLLKLIEINRVGVGLSEFTNLELPSPNKKNQSDS